LLPSEEGKEGFTLLFGRAGFIARDYTISSFAVLRRTDNRHKRKKNRKIFVAYQRANKHNERF
jgi:hypothetical protein